MATPTQPEKLVYLQNGVFKCKEMTESIQYYLDNSFDTFAFPLTNGNYVLTKTDDVYTWSVAGEDFTSLDNSYFKGSDRQSIIILANGAIPFFKNNSSMKAKRTSCRTRRLGCVSLTRDTKCQHRSSCTLTLSQPLMTRTDISRSCYPV